jgi:phage replication O-like protein O
MANPQPDKFLKLSIEVVEKLAGLRIPGEAMQVLWVIFRKTYGFNKKTDWIGLGQFQDMTGLKKPSVIRALKLLESMNLISKNANAVSEKANPNGVTYGFQKDYDLWRPLAKKLTFTKKLTTVSENANDRLRKSKRTVSEKVNPSLAKKLPTIDNTTIDRVTTDTSTKDNITKDRQIGKKQIDEFLELYHLHLPFASKVMGMPLKREGHLKTSLKRHPEQGWWLSIFEMCANSPFLRGEVPPSNGHRQFKLDIDWLINEHNLVKIQEGRYTDDRASPASPFSEKTRRTINRMQEMLKEDENDRERQTKIL